MDNEKKNLPAEPQSEGLDHDAMDRILLNGYRTARQNFGMSRIEMGTFLHLIKTNGLWKGLAASWEAFIAADNINPHAARQYMNVAKRFVIELDVPPETLRHLSLAGITALENAGKVINESNKDEIIAALSSLSEKDAIQRIIEISSGVEPKAAHDSNLKVLALLRTFYDLPPDLQYEFKQKLANPKKQG